MNRPVYTGVPLLRKAAPGSPRLDLDRFRRSLKSVQNSTRCTTSRQVANAPAYSSSSSGASSERGVGSPESSWEGSSRGVSSYAQDSYIGEVNDLRKQVQELRELFVESRSAGPSLADAYAQQILRNKQHISMLKEQNRLLKAKLHAIDQDEQLILENERLRQELERLKRLR